MTPQKNKIKNKLFPSVIPVLMDNHQLKPPASSIRGGLTFFDTPFPGIEHAARSAARPRLATSRALARANFGPAELLFGHFALEMAEIGVVLQ